MTSYIIFILFLALIKSVLILVKNRQSVPVNLPAPEEIKTNSPQVIQRAFRKYNFQKNSVHHISESRVTPVPVESTPEQNINSASIFINRQPHSEEDQLSLNTTRTRPCCSIAT